MKKLGMYLVILSCVLLNLFCVHANADVSDRQTTEGTEFIFSFSPNYLADTELSLFISSKVDASGLIEIPRLGTSQFFQVSAGSLVKVSIAEAMGNLPKGKSNYGIRVTSDNPISLYGLNRQLKHTDAFLAIPTISLGKKYYAMSYRGISTTNPSQLAVVGVYDNTKVEITAPVSTNAGSAGTKYTVVLNKMETYLLSSSTSAGDLTGTLIQSDRPVSLTSGSKCSQVPYGQDGCDHLVEMIPPVNTWGTKFITYPLAKRLKGDLIRILASENNTKVTVNGVVVKTLAAGTYHDLMQTQVANKIETSAPVLVAQYALSQEFDDVVADPFMMLIPPTEQLLDAYTFATSDENIDDHYVNVVVRTADLSGLYLDGQPVNTSLFTSIDATYSGAKIQITPGVHSIKASSPFGLYAYGFGNFESYGYAGSMAIEAINAENQDYRNVRVISTLNTQDITLDPTSFTLQPEKITQAGQQTVIEWFFPSFSIGQIKNLDYEVLAKNLQPGESRIITNKLELSYQDINNVEHKRELGVQTLEVLSSGFGLSVATDKSVYGPDEKVLITTQASNAGASQVVTLHMEVRDSEDRYVANIETPPGFILSAGASITLNPQEFFTGSYFAGDYQIVAQLKDAQNIVVQETSATIRIQTETGGNVQLTNQTTTDKAIYNLKDVVNIDNVTSNISANQYLEKARLVIRVTHANGILWNESVDLIQLAPSTDETKTFSVSLADAAAGDYVVESTILDPDGATLASSQASFTVENNPLLSLTASVTVAETEYETGEVPSCNYQITNAGNLPVSQTIALRLVHIDESAEIFGLEKVVQLSSQVNDVTTPVLPKLLEEGDYACILEAKKNDQFQAMASAQFQVKASPVTFDGSMSVGDKARLLVLIDASSTERSYLENLLTQAGWYYTIVDTAAAFNIELTQGGYGVYALLSENISLDQTTQNVLNTKVAAGDGLIVAGATDSRHKTLEQSLGIKLREHEAYAKGISVDQSALGSAWSQSFTKSIPVLSFTGNSATVVGKYNNGLPNADTQTPLGALGAAERYGVFAIEDHTSLSSTIEGRMAVGGNLSLQNFSVGDKLDPSKLHDVVTVGGNVTFPSGKIYYGNLLAGGSVTGVGSAVRNGMAPGAVIRGNTPVNIRFQAEREYLQELSAGVGNLPVTGTVKLQWGTLELKGDCQKLVQVFTVQSADLAATNTLTTNCIPANATVVVNVLGQSATIQNMGMQALSAIREKVLFNFPSSTSLKLTSVAVEGSILAPYAKVDQPAGRVEGQVIVNSWYSTNYGYMSIHNRIFRGDLSAALGEVTKNAISLNQYQQGRSVFVGFDLLAQAQSIGADNSFAQLLLNALLHINPTTLARAEKVVPVLVNVTNTGQQISGGQVLLKFTNSVPVNMPGFTQTSGGDWATAFSLSATSSQGFLIYVKLPSGSANIQMQVQNGEPEWITRFENTLQFNLQ
jgi:choice-of-anchor A domain-containing protein